MQILIQSKDHERQVRVWEGVERVSFTQWARLEQGGFVLSFLVSHQQESGVLPPGEYVLDPSSFSTKNGRLSVDRVVLKSGRGSARIVIESKEYERQSRVWEGVERVSFTQWARLEQGGFVLSFLVSHQQESGVLPPGEYVLDPSSFSTKNGRLSVDRVVLKAAPRTAAKAA